MEIKQNSVIPFVGDGVDIPNTKTACKKARYFYVMLNSKKIKQNTRHNCDNIKRYDNA